MAKNAQPLLDLMRGTARERGLFPPAAPRLALAVSGGADSVCLLHAMAQLAPEFGLQLCVAHLNHGVRGADSDADQKFVRELAESFGFDFYTETIDVPALVESGGPSLEQVCRSQRMEFYTRALKYLGAQRIATGHTLSDQAETVLMRVLRGTSLRGLAAMDFVSGSIIRPLLAAPRELVRAYVKENGLAFREDATNADEHFLRNRVRRTLMPVIQDAFNARAEASLFSLSQLLRTDLDFLEDQARRAYHKILIESVCHEIHLDLMELQNLHDAVLSRVLIRAYHDALGLGQARPLSREHVADLIHAVRHGATGHVVELPGFVVSERGYEAVIFKLRSDNGLDGNTESQQASGHFEHAFDMGQIINQLRNSPSQPAILTFDPPGIDLEITLMTHIEQALFRNPDPSIAYFDAAGMAGPLTLRAPRPGDRFHPLGMAREKKLHDYFIDEKIPVSRRSGIPVLVSGNDMVWVMGYRIDHRFRVKDETNAVICIALTNK